MNETIQAFIDAINAHDVESLESLMSDDHIFIDPHGNEMRGKETMIAGWRGYFEWFPDYYVEVTDEFANGELFAMFGFAGGSFKGQADSSWRLPVAWKTIVKDGRVALWQVFADTKIPFEIIERG
jgi:limonene-1,2-epoxide hydrolase